MSEPITDEMMGTLIAAADGYEGRCVRSRLIEAATSRGVDSGRIQLAVLKWLGRQEDYYVSDELSDWEDLRTPEGAVDVPATLRAIAAGVPRCEAGPWNDCPHPADEESLGYERSGPLCPRHFDDEIAEMREELSKRRGWMP